MTLLPCGKLGGKLYEGARVKHLTLFRLQGISDYELARQILLKYIDAMTSA